jgi:hypothetical protein
MCGSRHHARRSLPRLRTPGSASANKRALTATRFPGTVPSRVWQHPASGAHPPHILRSAAKGIPHTYVCIGAVRQEGGVGYRRRMAHIRIGEKSWNVTDDSETVLRHLTNSETYVGELTGSSGALVISSTLNWAVVSAKQPAVDPSTSAF